MNHKIFSSLTASLLITTLGVLPSYANPTTSDNQGVDTSPKPVDSNADPIGEAAPKTPTGARSARVDQPSTEAVKIGEQKPAEQKSESVPKRDTASSSQVIAKVQSHSVAGRKGAILYVRNLPVLTFTGSTATSSGSVKVGVQNKPSTGQPDFRDKALGSNNPPETLSIPSLLSFSQSFTESNSDSLSISTLDEESAQADPVWRATVLASRINQLHRTGLDAKKITVRWDDQQKLRTGDRFLIQADQLPIATIDRNTTAATSNRTLEQDALWVANRLRRLLGNAEPLQSIAGRPAGGGQTISLGPIQIRLEGFASWYGPGFHGNPSASGERFNQYALTAAHRTLPFGTKVLVTNLDTGQSVVVRINDRGPFHSNRIIDLSTGAARMVGLVQSGVARVRLEVMDPNNVATTNQ